MRKVRWLSVDRDLIIQKYLTGKCSPEERKWLLDSLLGFYNGMLSLMDARDRLRKGGRFGGGES